MIISDSAGCLLRSRPKCHRLCGRDQSRAVRRTEPSLVTVSDQESRDGCGLSCITRSLLLFCVTSISFSFLQSERLLSHPSLGAVQSRLCVLCNASRASEKLTRLSIKHPDHLTPSNTRQPSQQQNTKNSNYLADCVMCKF